MPSNSSGMQGQNIEEARMLIEAEDYKKVQ